MHAFFAARAFGIDAGLHGLVFGLTFAACLVWVLKAFTKDWRLSYARLTWASLPVAATIAVWLARQNDPASLMMAGVSIGYVIVAPIQLQNELSERPIIARFRLWPSYLVLAASVFAIAAFGYILFQGLASPWWLWVAVGMAFMLSGSAFQSIRRIRAAKNNG